MPIVPPQSSPKRELARKLFDAFLSEVPLIGGPMAALYSVSHPAKGEIEQARWQGDVTNLLNSLETALDYISGSITMSEDAAFLGRWISSSSRDGWSHYFHYNEIVVQFTQASQNEILEAVGELELEGMLEVRYFFGSPLGYIIPKHKLFEVFDPVVFPNVSPRADASTVAQELLTSESGISAGDVTRKYGWSVRRLNPALQIIGEFIAEPRKSKEKGAFAIPFMFVDARERAALRRFVNQVEGR